MPSQKNIDQVQSLIEKLSQAKAVILADYAGLSVSQQSKLRQKVRDAGGQFVVAKNRLFKLALSETRKSGLPREVEDVLRGPTSFLFAFEDDIGPLKALFQFTDEHGLPSLKLGLLLKPEDRVLSIEEIESLAKLSTREELISRLLTTLNTPSYRLVHALSGNIRRLSLVIKAISDKKQATLKH